MKVVIDTNVLVSAVLKDRLPEQVILWCVGNPDVTWLASPAILAEYEGVIRRPKFALPAETLAWWLELLVSDTVLVFPESAIDFPRDRKDAAFLECAKSGQADYLLTGDGDFAEAGSLISAKIVNVREFAAEIGLVS